MIYKTIFQLLLYAVLFYGGLWSFNHINPWIGILIIVLIISYLINKIYKFLKQKSK